MTDCPCACGLPGDPVWARPCQARIRDYLIKLDYAAALLTMAADGHREIPMGEAPSGMTGRRKGYITRPSPVAELVDELESKLLEAERGYRQLCGLPSAMRHGGLAGTRTEAVGFLHDHLGRILADPRTADFGHLVTDWHNRLIWAGRLGSGFRRGQVACPRCGLKLLGGRIGAGFMVCGNCNRYVRDDEYDALIEAAKQRLAGRAG